MAGPAAILAPELAYVGGRFERDLHVELRADGRIGRVGRRLLDRSDPVAGATLIELPRRALLPGFVNAHSHAFQRGLRGLGESFPAGAGSFWSWREAMYSLVDRLDPTSLHELSLRCFREMLAAGITTVGEFHYVHRDGDGRWAAMDDAVLAAARDAGIRIVLLQCAYRTGAIGQPLRGGQVRFDTAGHAEFLAAFDRLAEALDPRTQSAAIVAHSVRAVPWEEIIALRAAARERGTVFHMHVEEVIPEIEDCLEAYGRRPMQMVVDDLEVDSTFTAVHCTHTAPSDMARFVAAGGTVCLCPLTEGNLGDGVHDAPGILARGGRIAFGTDLNSRLCVFEELRWIEYLHRLVRRERGVLRDAEGVVSPRLLAIATEHGARALGVEAGRIAEGRHADLFTVDLDHAELDGADARSLADALVFGCGNAAIEQVWVDGIERRAAPMRGSAAAGPPPRETAARLHGRVAGGLSADFAGRKGTLG